MVRHIALWVLLACAVPAWTGPLNSPAIPEALKPWIPWALYGHEADACPHFLEQPGERRCAWPGELDLELHDGGGNFRSRWRSFVDTWVPLPGDPRSWPLAVELDGRPATVSTRNAVPGVRLPPGAHTIAGRFLWTTMPDTLRVPIEIGLVRLSVGGRAIAFPSVDDQGQLWLRKTPDGAAPETSPLKLEVFRLLRDAVPMEVSTRLELDVSGETREVLLEGSLLPGFIPLSLNSPLPARLEPDGRLRLQLRPGHWNIGIDSRANRDGQELALPAFAAPWPREELWSFAADRSIRVAEISGAPLVNPRLTRLPEEYRSLPTYAMAPDTVLRFDPVRRGDPEPEPDTLAIRRSLWLDFSGQGLTILDDISGRITRNWRLDAAPAMKPGRVTVDGQPQTITRLDAGPGGVEIRRGELHLRAESRWEAGVSSLPATGWNTDFVSAAAELHLPPGWRLFAAPGADHVPDSWIGRWSLLDLFLVLITTLAAARLWGWPAGSIALLTLTLTWHEPDAPQSVWLWLLGVTALGRVIPSGSFASALRIVRMIVLAALAIASLPFAVQQLRLSLYPQLEPHAMAFDYGGQAAETAAIAPAAPAMVLREKSGSPEEAETPPPADPSRTVDPDALTQTGPGLPQWQWHRITLNWNGPVLDDQQLRLLLIPPWASRGLNVLRVALLAVTVLLLLGWRGKSGVSGLMVLPLLLVITPDSRAGEFPPPALLDELETRLLAAPECGTECAQIERMKLRIRPGDLLMTLKAHAEQRVAIPLPAQAAQWIPSRIRVDGDLATGPYANAEGLLWLMLDPGVHRVELSGPLPKLPRIDLPLPLRPHRVDIESDGWEVIGIDPNGKPEPQVQFVRRGGSASTERRLESAPLPVFLAVERTLRLGLDWRVATRVTRLSPAEAPVALNVPLLPGEAVISPGISTENGSVRIHLPPGILDANWESTLDRTGRLELRAPQTSDWTEIWRLDASPVWHIETSGIPVAHHQDAGGHWLPEWRPWPGETVTLLLSRPPAVPGNALTIESSALETRPGQRATDTELALGIRSAKGGQHGVTLPEGAELQSVEIDGTAQPIRLNGSAVTLPLHPGEQTVRLTWRTPVGIGLRTAAPRVDIGSPSVNSRIGIELGQDRWVLLVGGPTLGPSVLFWGTLGVIVIAAVALGMRLDRLPLKIRHWLLLLIGLSQVPLAASLVVIGWIGALEWRGHGEMPPEPRHFNLIQSGLALLTVLALSILLSAVHQGLLGLPDMGITGYDSSAYRLNWYTDRSGPLLPRPWVVSVPLFAYRLLMLAWALWLAYALLDWLRWGWGCFSAGGLWRQNPGTAPAAGVAPPRTADTTAPNDPWQR
ncbi:hypothetical protein [Methylococcus geothermalis]|uniref:Uncharacterized protein n=1 Tax=Methylococcus geothermalis TaxID=2681310 RepID=A0A858Q4D5_9GAMM|nr:hypothetical protein [Methylococcus geothermalis]QJD28684.1 hypothetical protein GNH96_01000 [Methylococcus geothermalis]